jgi:hypothetical protein
MKENKVINRLSITVDRVFRVDVNERLGDMQTNGEKNRKNCK